MYKQMLVLLDGSELSEVVFAYAQELSGRLGLDLELLHVASPQEADQMPMRRAYMESMAATLCSKAEEIRTAAGVQAVGECIMAHGNVAVGDPAEMILEYVDDNDIDLVLMATRGRSGLRSGGLGGVAYKVVHGSKVPVWLVPAELREEIVADSLAGRPLVIPLSGSKMAESAIPHALNIAAQRGAESEFVLVHVAEETSVAYTPEIVRDIQRKRAEMQAYLDGVAEGIRQAGYTVSTELLSGDPAKSIIEYLMANPPQLIVMATRGKSGISRMIFGSVTESVIQMIKKTPMLLVSGAE